MLKINNDKAIAIAQDRIRVWRHDAFTENDVKIQNSLVDGDETARVEAVAYRNYLRDLPQNCEGKTVDELKLLLDAVGIQ